MCTTANNREIIEPRIIQLVRELTAAPATDEVADALKPVMEQVVDQAASSSQGGKRLRALLALDAFDILAGDVTPDRRDAMIDLACAIEVFQTAALVHDDIIDESDLRRGRPSAHRALEQAVLRNKTEGQYDGACSLKNGSAYDNPFGQLHHAANLQRVDALFHKAPFL